MSLGGGGSAGGCGWRLAVGAGGIAGGSGWGVGMGFRPGARSPAGSVTGNGDEALGLAYGAKVSPIPASFCMIRRRSSGLQDFPGPPWPGKKNISLAVAISPHQGQAPATAG